MYRMLLVLAVAMTSGCGFLDDEIAQDIHSGFGLGISGTGGWGCGGSISTRRGRASILLGEPDVEGVRVLAAADPQTLAYRADAAPDGSAVDQQRRTSPESDPWLAAFVEAEKEVDTVLSSADLKGVPPAN